MADAGEMPQRSRRDLVVDVEEEPREHGVEAQAAALPPVRAPQRDKLAPPLVLARGEDRGQQEQGGPERRHAVRVPLAAERRLQLSRHHALVLAAAEGGREVGEADGGERGECVVEFGGRGDGDASDHRHEAQELAPRDAVAIDAVADGRGEGRLARLDDLREGEAAGEVGVYRAAVRDGGDESEREQPQRLAGREGRALSQAQHPERHHQTGTDDELQRRERECKGRATARDSRCLVEDVEVVVADVPQQQVDDHRGLHACF
mmetsp:Transcript_40387/g.127722  ORF Transcript_40387/g.127722 Transcript_40387/m.127722 type:complete len:263 (+) Transcript_40387:596-1384(+)